MAANGYIPHRKVVARPTGNERRATEQVFTNLEFAESIKTVMAKYIPRRCFAVETVMEDPPTGRSI